MSFFAVLIFSVFAFAETRLCVMDQGEKTPSEMKLTKLLKEQTKDCKACRIKSFSIPNGKTPPKPADFAKKISESKGQCDILLLNWNRPFSPDWMPTIESLQKAAAEGRLIVGAAGAATGKSKGSRLSATLWGRLQQDLFIIGELNRKGELMPNSYQGPGLFTALTAPKGHSGSAASAALFAAALASRYPERDANLWRIRLSNNKAAVTKPWPTLADLFEDKSLHLQ